MTLLLPLLFALAPAGPEPLAEGKATRYDPGIMARVVDNRVRYGQIDLDVPHRDYVALASCEHLGERVMLVLADGRVSGPHLVADCGAAGDQAHLAAIGFGVDLSWQLALELEAVDAPLPGVRAYLFDPDAEKPQRRPR